MELPMRLDLPFFSYGIFKPGQLGFYQIKEYVVNSIEDTLIWGKFLQRDGLPILKLGDETKSSGALLYFKEGNESKAYNRIIGMEPDHQYRWGTAEVITNKGRVESNVLIGKSPNKGTVVLEENWDGKNDPLFTSALEVIKETLEQNKAFQWDLKPLFRLQMAYLLLWSSIERYLSLRYGLGRDVTSKIGKLCSEDAFIEKLEIVVKEKREVIKAYKPAEKCVLDPCNPKKSLDYYYQVRSNITHRGKSVNRDFTTILLSLKELYEIFKAVLDNAFKDHNPL